MPRRIHVPSLAPGDTPLDAAQAHHARDVLRLADGTDVEVFDDAGRVARGVLLVDAAGIFVRVERLDEAPASPGVLLTVAAAVPKGDRADWMVEKLSELGVAEFIPLAAARSVVLPEGRNKRERWVRIATEAAKQSRRSGVMRIGELTPLAQALETDAVSWYLATEAGVATLGIGELINALVPGARVCAFIGPEGGWAGEELQQFAAAGGSGARLTETVLRVETAAVAVAAVVGSLAVGRRGPP